MTNPHKGSPLKSAFTTTEWKEVLKLAKKKIAEWEAVQWVADKKLTKAKRRAKRKSK